MSNVTNNIARSRRDVTDSLKSFEQIAFEMGISKTRVLQLYHEALEVLRKQADEHPEMRDLLVDEPQRQLDNVRKTPYSPSDDTMDTRVRQQFVAYGH